MTIWRFPAAFSLFLVTCVSVAALECAPYSPPLRAEPTDEAATQGALPPLPPTSFKVSTGGSVAPNLVFVGDSLTRGTGASSPEFRYPRLVSRLLGDRAYAIYAQGGQSARKLADLLGNTLKVEGTYVIWAGHAGRARATQTLDAVRDMVSTIPSSKFLVLSVIPGNISGVSGEEGQRRTNEQVNMLLAEAFPDNFLEVGQGLECDDIRDRIHLRNTGYAKIANVVAAELAYRGW